MANGHDTGSGADIAPRATAYDTDAEAHTPVREVTVGDHDLTRADIDIEIGHAATGEHTFECAVWNLDPNVWAQLRQGARVTIRLGWQPEPIATVLRGALVLKRTRSVGADRQFILRGRSQATQALQAGHTATWQRATLTDIARAVAARAGLRVGQLGDPDADGGDSGPAIQGYWAIRRDRPLAYWLDRLVAEAGQRTGEQWHWYTHDGDKLSVTPKRVAPTQSLTLRYDRSLRRLTPTLGRSKAARRAEIREREFVAALEPHLTRGRVIEVPEGAQGDTTTTDTTRHVVLSYAIQSSTRTGSHEIRGRLVPAGVSFPARYPGGRKAHHRAYGSPAAPERFEQPYPRSEVPTDPEDSI